MADSLVSSVSTIAMLNLTFLLNEDAVLLNITLIGVFLLATLLLIWIKSVGSSVLSFVFALIILFTIFFLFLQDLLFVAPAFSVEPSQPVASR